MSYYYRKMWIGVAINIVFGSIGPVLWTFAMDQASGMAKSLRPWAILVFFAACIPAIIFYGIWYKKNVSATKININSEKRPPNSILYFIFGLVGILAISLGVGFVFFMKAAKYAIITAACATVGSATAYIVGKS